MAVTIIDTGNRYNNPAITTYQGKYYISVYSKGKEDEQGQVKYYQNFAFASWQKKPAEKAYPVQVYLGDSKDEAMNTLKALAKQLQGAE